MKNIEEIRRNFPILDKKTQLSSCSQSALHKDVKYSLEKYIHSWEFDGMDWELWMDVCESARNKFAQLINAKPSEISIVSSVSHGISSIVTSLNPQEDKRDLLVSENDFPCVGHISLSQKDYNVRFIDYAQDDLNIKINKNTFLTSIPHVSFYNGAIADVKNIIQHAKNNNSYVCVDAYQSAGQVEIDVKELDVDFLVTGMQKYLLGVPGIAFLYVKEEVADSLTPKITGWFGQDNPFAFDGKHIHYATGAKRFDTGTYPMINGFAAESALNIILDVGVTNIQNYIQDLSSYTIDYCNKNNLEIASPKEPSLKGSNTAIKINNASKVEQELKKMNILVSARNDVIRIAPHFYNTTNDIKIAIDKLLTLI